MNGRQVAGWAIAGAWVHARLTDALQELEHDGWDEERSCFGRGAKVVGLGDLKRRIEMKRRWCDGRSWAQ
jgi:hypothetical protein